MTIQESEAALHKRKEAKRTKSHFDIKSRREAANLNPAPLAAVAAPEAELEVAHVALQALPDPGAAVEAAPAETVAE